MMQAAAFGGGVWVRGKLNDIKLPQFKVARDEGDTFKLSVRVLSASIPALGAPGMVRRERPRLEIVLGDTTKVTELGDFTAIGEAPTSGTMPDLDSEEGAQCPPCPWRFGDTLTFVAHLADVVGPGLRLNLRTSSEVRLGPLQVDMSAMRELAASNVDLRRRVLPACVNCRQCDPDGNQSTSDPSGGQRLWETPVLVIPFAHAGGIVPDVVGQAAAHATIVFSVTTDPEALLRAAENATRPLSDKVVQPLRQIFTEPVRWVNATGALATCGNVGVFGNQQVARRGDQTPTDFGRTWSGQFDPPATPSAASTRLTMSKSTKPATFAPQAILGMRPVAPDLSPDGWVYHHGSNGRIFWHHKSLGPAPWELDPSLLAGNSGVPKSTSSTVVLSTTASSNGVKSSSLSVEEAGEAANLLRLASGTNGGSGNFASPAQRSVSIASITSATPGSKVSGGTTSHSPRGAQLPSGYQPEAVSPAPPLPVASAPAGPVAASSPEALAAADDPQRPPRQTLSAHASVPMQQTVLSHVAPVMVAQGGCISRHSQASPMTASPVIVSPMPHTGRQMVAHRFVHCAPVAAVPVPAPQPGARVAWRTT
mmetsp:Transcript_111012/g.313033  ORF Transcript_111012/g.313033 Transcript_111012/m.313033 type:complete len:594 (-) Transcript_111012:282-2063(-)|eukprot:CAMPEP_0117468918 /NCGR_PEP_ID=MMETSP0784-20121206/6426_1 /TAXON_ID=39447 /ORGANISM="" /LENGTH=593 /DNA_ID=CAMNT_0005262947 /DNA_START=78 /DNA_END=1859 /DNA_ORIENTATION=-